MPSVPGHQEGEALRPQNMLEGGKEGGSPRLGGERKGIIRSALIAI